jgi:hypothetical protein
MRNVLMLAGAAMMALGATAADAQKGKAKAKVHVNSAGFVDINRNGIADLRERRIDVNRNRIDDRFEARFRLGNDFCPPGLAKKNNGCLPPGQAKRLFVVGQRVPTGFGVVRFNQVPVDIRTRFDLSADDRFVIRDRFIYVVDPRTRLVDRIIDLLL